jgi:hypothetical protein
LVFAIVFHVLSRADFFLVKEYNHHNCIDKNTKFLEMWKNADEDLPELIDAKKRVEDLNVVSVQ